MTPMKSALAAVAISLFASSAVAADTKNESSENRVVFEETTLVNDDLDPNLPIASTSRFEAAKALNNAWLRVVFTDHDEDDESFEEVRLGVKGLTVDGDQIVYQDDLGKTVCATIGTKVQPTGRCQITTRTKRVLVDDGFAGLPRTRVDVRLTVSK